MPDLDEFALAKLAKEMAINIRHHEAIFADFKINETEYYEITKIPFFQRAKEQYSLEWNSTLSTKDRVALLSATLIEQALPVLGARMLNPQEPLPATTDVAKFLAKNAGIGEIRQGAGNQSERFVITINLGADVDGKEVVETYNKSLAIDANDVNMVVNKDVNTAPLPPKIEQNWPEMPEYAPQSPEGMALAALMEHDE